ncbi:ABC transporter ATP-binding protein [Paenarthrobacter sp. NPDC057981]|uniref:ABC transporter ATP-binding protein n=1 Tax=Paenarthrobacter sp. NPDC057981 TaxID=3346297 RepID=UPI0036DC4A4A
MDNALLSVSGLSVTVPSRERADHTRGDLRLVDGVSFEIARGERLALVGESGSGKSLTARSILRLDSRMKLEGSISWRGEDLLSVTERRMREIRGADISLILQDPLTALNPVMTIGQQIAEPLTERGVSRKEALKRAAEMLDRLRVPRAKDRLKYYPAQFSGGMRQRVVMAAALVGEPKLLIADEPTTALDVRVQEQVLDLLEEISRELHASVLFITHDLGIVAGLAQRVAVMFKGQIVENGLVDTVFSHPSHPYTKGLIGSVPRLDADPSERLRTVEDFLEETEVKS